jgi:diaminohydroxyphosphoribosylaminopyrimidine deaminase/5-amino-6-(5-phosphoribosylamino)uracil reductase
MLRRDTDAVLVGIGTAIKDDPELTVRYIASDRQPTRIVFDSKCKLPIGWSLSIYLFNKS